MYAQQLGPIAAEEAQENIAQLLAGTGHMEKRSRENYIHELQARAGGTLAQRQALRRPSSFEEITASGIVVIEKPTKKPKR